MPHSIHPLSIVSLSCREEVEPQPAARIVAELSLVDASIRVALYSQSGDLDRETRVKSGSWERNQVLNSCSLSGERRSYMFRFPVSFVGAAILILDDTSPVAPAFAETSKVFELVLPCVAHVVSSVEDLASGC